MIPHLASCLYLCVYFCLYAYLNRHHLCACYLRRPEEGVRIPGTRITVVSLYLGAVVAQTFNPSTLELGSLEFEASLIYTVSSRTARAIE